MKYLGKYYLYIITELTAEFQPPYKIWIIDKGFMTINNDILENWANSDVLIE